MPSLKRKVCNTLIFRITVDEFGDKAADDILRHHCTCFPLGILIKRTIGHYLMLCRCTFLRLGMAWQLEMIIMFSTYHAPLPPTMPLFKPAFLAALDSSFTSLFNDFWDVTTTTGNVHCIPCRLTGRKMRGKTFAQWFCKSDKKKVINFQLHILTQVTKN